MLQQFFVIFIFFIFLTIIFIAQRIIRKRKLILPIYRFVEKEISIKEMYEGLFKQLLQEDFYLDKKVRIRVSDYKIQFSSCDEASIEFEKIIKDTLNYYDEIGDIALIDDELRARKDELVAICYKVRELRWQKKQRS